MTATTCDTGSGLLRAVLADPASDAARLIYADYLEEQGQADRAEFIRVQCELERREAKRPRAVPMTPENDALWDELLKLRGRQSALWTGRRAAEWWPDLRAAVTLHRRYRTVSQPPGTTLAVVTRGFVTEIRLPLAAFLAHARDLFSRHPITAVVISDAVIHPSGGNDTYYLGGLGRFPKEHWRRLDGLPSVRAVQDAVSGVCVHWGRSLAGLPPLE